MDKQHLVELISNSLIYESQNLKSRESSTEIINYLNRLNLAQLRIMSKEFSNYNIRVNAVAPNVTATEMLDKMDKKAMEKMLKMSNLSEPLSTSEVADEVLFLASEKSLQVNGQIIRLEGNKIDK